MSTTEFTEVIDRGSGRKEFKSRELARNPDMMNMVGATKRVVRNSGDLSVTDTSWVLLTGMTKTITLPAAGKLFIAVLAYGKAAVGQDLRLTLFLNGVNMGGSGGLGFTENDKAGCLSINGLSGVLAAGDHTVELKAKVSGGTGTVFAAAASSPLAVSIIAIEGDLAEP